MVTFGFQTNQDRDIEIEMKVVFSRLSTALILVCICNKHALSDEISQLNVYNTNALHEQVDKHASSAISTNKFMLDNIVIPAISGTILCDLLLYRLLDRKHKCGERRCNGFSPPWSQIAANHTSSSGIGARVIVSYGHNGFGNQLFQHTVCTGNLFSYFIK